MSISRRTALKRFLYIAGGAVLIPSCVQREDNKTSLLLKNLKVTGTDEQTLAALMETILPATNTPGAKDLYLHQFALKMVDDCHGPEDQQAFSKGLADFGKYAHKRFNKNFTELDATQRIELMQALESKKDLPEDLSKWYDSVKGLTIQGYLTSKHYLTQVQVYELVPGRFRGCVPISEIKKASVRPV